MQSGSLLLVGLALERNALGSFIHHIVMHFCFFLCTLRDTCVLFNCVYTFSPLNFCRREESLPIFKRRLFGRLLDFAATELQAQVTSCVFSPLLLLL